MVSSLFRASKYSKLFFPKIGKTVAVRRFSGFKYMTSHEYLTPTDEKNVFRVGISEHAVEQMGEVVFVELPEPEDEFKAGEIFGSVESVKAASDVYLPISGAVTKVNQILNDSPYQLNELPVDEAWFVEIKATSDDLATELGTLLSEEKYKAHVAEELEDK